MNAFRLLFAIAALTVCDMAFAQQPVRLPGPPVNLPGNPVRLPNPTLNLPGNPVRLPGNPVTLPSTMPGQFDRTQFNRMQGFPPAKHRPTASMRTGRRR